MIKYFFLFTITLLYAVNFQSTPDFTNYYNDWIMGSFFEISDPVSRVLFTSFEFFNLPYFTFPFVFLLLYLYFSKCYSFIKFIFIISSFPIIFNSLITPRFFAGLLFFAISLDYFIKDFKKTSLLFLLLSIGTHLSTILFTPIFIIFNIASNNKTKITRLILYLIFFIIISWQFNDKSEIYDLFSYRLDQTGTDELDKSKPSLHYLTACFMSFGLYHFRKTATDYIIFLTYSIFYFILFLLSFYYYDLIISRIFHGLSILSLFFLIRLLNFNSLICLLYSIYFSCGGLILFSNNNLFNNSYGYLLQCLLISALIITSFVNILLKNK